MATLTQTGAINNLPHQVRYTTLLWILAVAPLCGAIALIDQIFLGGTVQKAMDIDIQTILYITAILTFPHIIASLIGFADKEYLVFYRKPLLKGVAISFGIAFGLEWLIGGTLILFVVAFYSVYHNIMQQFGITAMALRQKQTLSYKIMKWMIVIPSALVFVLIMFPFATDMEGYKQPFMLVITACLLAATALALDFYRNTIKSPNHTQVGIYYFIGNLAWLYISYFLVIAGYGLMAILLSRVIHDCTAYWIYMVHDQNRNRDKSHNIFYALPKKLGFPPMLMLIPIAFAISSLMLFFWGKIYIIAIIVSAFNLIHYYIEGHIWKHGTPHRRHVPFK